MFVHISDWPREGYRCVRCASTARGRALFWVLAQRVPQWPRLRLLEVAPYGAASWALESRCPEYVAARFRAAEPLGGVVDGVRNEDLRGLTFADASFDVVVTQDVFEHVLEPERAFAEIARVLVPGGVHVFTVPLHVGHASVARARPSREGIEHLKPAAYHGDPDNPEGSLVVTDWGDDIVDVIQRAAGMQTELLEPYQPRAGIEGPGLEVLVSRKANGYWGSDNAMGG